MLSQLKLSVQDVNEDEKRDFKHLCLVDALNQENEEININQTDGKGFYRCLFCKESVIPVKGNIRKHHFRHKKSSDCSSSGESVLHKYAKYILENNNTILLPMQNNEYQVFEYDNVSLETMYLDIIPDVKLESRDGKEVFIEIHVTNEVDVNKQERIQKQDKLFVEIHLKDYYRKNETIDYDLLCEYIIQSRENKKILNSKSFMIVMMILDILNIQKHYLRFKFEAAEVKQYSDKYAIIEFIQPEDSADLCQMILLFDSRYEDPEFRFFNYFIPFYNERESILINMSHRVTMDFTREMIEEDIYKKDYRLNSLCPFDDLGKSLNEIQKQHANKSFLAFNGVDLFVLVENKQELSATSNPKLKYYDRIDFFRNASSMTKEDILKTIMSEINRPLNFSRRLEVFNYKEKTWTFVSALE